MFCNCCSKFFLSLSLLALLTATAQADLMHPPVMGETVWYTAITEGSPSGDPLPLYGAPSIIGSGNELTFPTTGSFAATSEAGNGPDQTDGKLSFMVTAKPGEYLLGLLFDEVGLTSLKAPFGGDAFTSIDAFAVIDINEVAGVPVSIPSFTEFFDFDPQREFQHSVDATGATFSSDWRGEAAVRFDGPVTKVTVTLNNILFAATTSDDGTAALIDKKEFRVRVPTRTHIPEPTTIVLGCLFGMITLVVPSARMLKSK